MRIVATAIDQACTVAGPVMPEGTPHTDALDHDATVPHYGAVVSSNVPQAHRVAAEVGAAAWASRSTGVHA